MGFLMAASGVGALIGALYLAARQSVRGLVKMIVAATCLFGVSLIAFSFSRTVWFSLLMMLGAGWGMMVQMASCNTILQTIVDDDKRGRVMSFYTMAFAGKIGTPNTLLAAGIICLVVAGWFARKLPALRKQMRPIYERMGIIPEVGAGIQAATELTAPAKD